MHNQMAARGGIKLAKCKGCGRDIFWARTPSGKAMPCDAVPVKYWPEEKAPGKVVLINTGELVSCRFNGPDETARTGCTPHWATCPEAGKFKK